MNIKSTLKDIVNSAIGVMDVEVIKKSKIPFFFQPKYEEEIHFWRTMYERFQLWYDGKLEPLYGEMAPKENQKVKKYVKEKGYNALLTWLNIHQAPKYLEDLQLDKNVFSGQKLLDIGSGPYPSAIIYNDCEIYCLDPLLPLYMESGYPIHIYPPRIKYTFGFSENMPFEDSYFDAVISVNAIDHVDDFETTVKEIQRVIKPGGKMRFHIHYHKKTKSEPIELNDERVAKAFNWDSNFKKINESQFKRGNQINVGGDSFTLWSNF